MLDLVPIAEIFESEEPLQSTDDLFFVEQEFSTLRKYFLAPQFQNLYDNKNFIIAHTTLPTESSYFEASADSYTEEDYELVDSKEEEDYRIITQTSDLVVDNVEHLNKNLFSIEAYLMENFKDTEEFREGFKKYAESSYSFNQHFPESEIIIDVINATENAFGNETFVTFYVKTFNIPITDSDLRLESNSAFDKMFESFDILEFEAHVDKGFDVEPEANDETEEIHVTTTDIKIDKAATEITTIEPSGENLSLTLEATVDQNSDEVSGKYLT